MKEGRFGRCCDRPTHGEREKRVEGNTPEGAANEEKRRRRRRKRRRRRRRRGRGREVEDENKTGREGGGR